MQKPRLIALMSPVVLAIVTGPLLGSAVLAADPVVTVESGDTLTGISERHDVAIDDLVALNRLSDPNRIYVGQRLRIASAPAPAASAPTKVAAAKVHTVQAGEHLTGIARHYGVTIAAISAANGISNPSRIYAGQRLSIPGTPTAAPASAPAGSSSVPPSMAQLVAKRDAVRAVIVEEANRYGVPAALALAVAWQESGWQQQVVSHAGAVGVMQLMPATAEWVGSAMLASTVDIHDSRQNIRGGVRLLAHYLARYDGDRSRVLAAYYQGQWAMDHHGIYPVTRPYIASIIELERIFAR
ncbi:MAG: LysM peptidoglycan-binding domain-containing protein [Candidatus Limnocylindria bacterium]